ncbi:unnamed protein product [Mytilus coruscus]|uniref:Peptidase A2 domain-containing protein n=1 Tax=Mytilus coruscus TaxID=42192 RepID=A0A6J8CR09_MYTCO|nr:unnamed protein product [Mytilus coruscus]
MSDCKDLGACDALLFPKMSDCQDLGACDALLFLKMSGCQDLGACEALLFPEMSDCQDLETVHDIQVTAAYLKYPPGRMGRVVGRRKLRHQLMEQQTSIEMEQKIDIDDFWEQSTQSVIALGQQNFFIRKKEIDFKIDTGADVTVISDSDLKGINNIELMKANKRLSGQGNTNLNVVGKFQCMLETKDKFSVQDIYVVKGLSKPLLGRPAIQALGVIYKVNVSSVIASSEANNYYRGKYPKIFNGLGKTKWTYTIALGPDAKPFCFVNAAQSTVTFNG